MNAAALHAQTPPSTPSYENPPPLIAGARWHHVHVNSTDPATSIGYYTKYFDERARRRAWDQFGNSGIFWFGYQNVM